MSMALGHPLVYDPKTRTVINDNEATKLLQRLYREGYEHTQPETV